MMEISDYCCAIDVNLDESAIIEMKSLHELTRQAKTNMDSSIAESLKTTNTGVDDEQSTI